MLFKTLIVPRDCEGALQTAIRIRVIYLQSYREKCEADGHKAAADAIMQDIANLTMLGDKLAEARLD